MALCNVQDCGGTLVEVKVDGRVVHYHCPTCNSEIASSVHMKKRTMDRTFTKRFFSK